MYLGGRHFVLHKGLKFFQDQLDQVAECLTNDLQHTKYLSLKSTVITLLNSHRLGVKLDFFLLSGNLLLEE